MREFGELEMAIMDVMWAAESPCVVREVRERLRYDHQVAYTTVMTVLDILYRKQFYDSLLNDFFDKTRTILVTTHQVEEIQDVLTDLMFINRGRIVLNCTMDEFESRYVELTVSPEQVSAARALLNFVDA